MDNKNFLLVISKFPPEYSGPGVRIPRLYKYFQDKGSCFDLKIVCNGVEQTRNETYLYEGWSVRRITAEHLNRLFLALGFIPKRLSHSLIYQYEFVKTFLILYFSKSYKEIDLLHVAGHSGGTAAALLWSNIRKIPVLMELVTEHARYQQKLFFLFKIKPYKNSKIVTLTEKKKQECIQLRVENNRLWFRPNPIDEKKFKYEPEKKYHLRKELTPFTEDQIVIGNVAKIIPQKNQYVIIESLKYLPKNFVHILLNLLSKNSNLIFACGN
jgi:glycosyltransferase involved in cell wall biosynthesis